MYLLNNYFLDVEISINQLLFSSEAVETFSSETINLGGEREVHREGKVLASIFIEI